MSKGRGRRPTLREYIMARLPERERLIEGGKSVLIVLLIISAGFLSTRSGLFDRGGSRQTEALSSTAELFYDASAGYTTAAEPFCIVVTPDSGSHYAAMYSEETLDEVYGKFSAVLGEALGSASEPETVGAEQWRAALRGGGVYFDFYSDQPLSVLAGWLGTAMTAGAGGHTARRLCLSEEDGFVSLYYIRARESGDAVYRCSTALGWSALSGRIGEYLPNGAVFNFELETPYELVDPYAVISAKQPRPQSLTARAPEHTAAEDEQLLKALGMISGLAVPYTESDGTAVYVEGDATLRIAPTGVASLVRTGDYDGEENMSPARTIENVRALLAETLGAKSGAAELYLSYIALDTQTGLYTLRFEYRVGGLPVSLGAGLSAANVTLRGTVLTEAKLVFREYMTAESVEKPLPPMQAAAIVQSLGGGEPVLTYSDDLENVTAGWIIA